ncbi:MAG: hypothetical protein HYV40_03490 [Candidatus Levybacteria bacterium]|nr:hypothetical protein [Candidatus Levybacteria bacterium]
MKHSNDDYLYFQKECSKKELLIKKKPLIGIHGIVGSFTDEALYRLAQKLGIKPEEYEVEELVHSNNVIRSVVDGKVDVGIFAVANSGSGAYLASIEAMATYTFRVLSVFTMKIHMCIISQATSIRNVEEFRGHPVAISQCRRTLQKKWPKIPVHADTDEMDTALSVKLLSEGKMNKEAAVFASKRAADIYGLNVLVEGAHDDPLNATSFIVIKK